MIRHHRKTAIGAFVALVLAIVPSVALASSVTLDSDITVGANAKTSFTVPSAVLDASGYLVIHEGTATTPGAAIGASALLEAGTHAAVKIDLDRPIASGEYLWVMMHVESNANTSFDGATVDIAAVDATNGNADLGNQVVSRALVTIGLPTLPSFQGTIPVRGVALVLFEGGSIADLVAAAQAQGVTTVSTTVDGKFTVHVVGAPAFVNAAFDTRFEAGFPGQTPMVLTKR